jgi:hypothetical protein
MRALANVASLEKVRVVEIVSSFAEKQSEGGVCQARGDWKLERNPPETKRNPKIQVR